MCVNSSMCLCAYVLVYLHEFFTLCKTKINQKRWVHDIIVCVFDGFSDSQFDCCENYVLQYINGNALGSYHNVKKFKWFFVIIKICNKDNILMFKSWHCIFWEIIKTYKMQISAFFSVSICL